MKKWIVILATLLIAILGFLWWQQHPQDKEFMKSLMLHQPVDKTEIDAMHMWVQGEDPQRIPLDENIQLIDSFNEYEASRVSEEKAPQAEAQIMFNLQSGYTIILNYVDSTIYVSRDDVGAGLVEYVLLDDAPLLEASFENSLP
ncbi:hypothetical protein HNQ94_001758 [Salirhabdus euzebyi]|uniref:Uncharacterized protein n=1 Tax=Salirhabdus euzebyi TaxID=394506 RepID=A0A841Q4N7_9BACI|nr:hypothetical protein [Salirhabdus euzebyi]MBB6453310.1 hypothetical protein [Salirhabdus euzebyi]